MLNNIIGDQDEIIITEYTLDDQSYIKMNEYLTACNVLINSDVKNNGDEVFYVDCPNEDKHGSDSNTATMIFHCEGEKNPKFFCHHAQCRHLNFNDFINHHKNLYENSVNWKEYLSEDSDNAPDKPIEEYALLHNITFHGYSPEDGNVHVFSSTDSFMICKYKPSDLTRNNIYNLFSNESMWSEIFGMYDKERNYKGLNFDEIPKWLLERSKKAGVYKENKIRNIGIHKEKDHYVLNTGEFVLTSNGDQYTYFQTREHYKENIYIPSRVTIYLSKNETTRDKINSFIGIIKKLPFKSEFDLVKFLGIMVCGLIPGAIETRPYMWVVGKSGSGKTKILEHTLSPIWMASGATHVEIKTTSAGIEQNQKGRNVSIIYDEAEADTKKSTERISDVVEGSKSSATSGVGVTLKGTSGGRNLSYAHKACYCFSSVADLIKDPTIKRRIVKVEIQQKQHHKKAWKTLKRELKSLINDDFCKELFLYFFNRIDKFNHTYEKIEDLISETEIGSEIMQLWASIFTGYLLLNCDEITNDNINQHVGKFITMIENENDGDNSESNTAVFLFETILNTSLSTADNKRVFVTELIQVCLGLGTHTTISMTEKTASDLLTKHGIKLNRERTHIFIHTKHTFLEKLFKNMGYGNYSSRLTAYPGAYRTNNTVSFFASRNRATALPIPELLREVEKNNQVECVEYTGELPIIFNQEIKL